MNFSHWHRRSSQKSVPKAVVAVAALIGTGLKALLHRGAVVWVVSYVADMTMGVSHPTHFIDKVT